MAVRSFNATILCILISLYKLIMHFVKYLNFGSLLFKRIILLVLYFFITSCTTFEKADKIYINGNIYTGIESDTRYSYIATKDDIILSLGSDTYLSLIHISEPTRPY